MVSFFSKRRRPRWPLMCVALALPAAGEAATTVSMRTVLGEILIQLYDQTAPKTVENFLSYVDSGAYDGSFIHRSMPGFVVQGGGFGWNAASNTYYTVPAGPPVQNEFGASNLRGTIAMAKLGGNPDSATNQWFFNLADNSANLDAQNGGFTVFGQVVGGGMAVVDAIAAMPTANAGGAFTNLPYIPPIQNNALVTQNMVLLESVKVVPVPAAAWLLGSALLGFLGAVKRRRPNAALLKEVE